MKTTIIYENERLRIFEGKSKRIYLILTGANGSLDGYNNKYNIIANNKINNYNAWVIVIATNHDELCIGEQLIKEAFKKFDELTNSKHNDYDVYCFGHSLGGCILCTCSYKFDCFKKIVAINPGINRHYDEVYENIDKSMAPITIVIGTLDKSYEKSKGLSNTKAKLIYIDGAEHSFRNQYEQVFIDCAGLLEDNNMLIVQKIAENRKYIYINSLRYLIELNELNKQLGGKSIVTPVLLSESLCKDLFKLDGRKASDHDAVDLDGLKIEIKATSSKKGTTTYNSDSAPDIYIWMFFDYDNKIIEIKSASKDEFDKNITTTTEDDSEVIITANQLSKRKSITLSNIKWTFIAKISMLDLNKC